MKKNYKSIFIFVVLIVYLFISLLYIDRICDIILEFNDLFIKRLFPVSLVFFIISNLLIEYNFFFFLQKIFKIKSVFLYAFILSLISGFPSGAVIIHDLLDKKLIDVNEANKIIMFSHFPNPLFVLNSVSLVTNKSYALIILFSIILSNFIIYCFIPKENITIDSFHSFPNSFSGSLSKVIYKVFKTLIMIYSVSLIFYITSYFISDLFINNSYIYVFINGLFDLTKGCFFSKIIVNDFIRCIYLLFFIVFGSLSIHMQIKSILQDTSVSYKKFFIGRIIGFILSIIIFSITCKFLLY